MTSPTVFGQALSYYDVRKERSGESQFPALPAFAPVVYDTVTQKHTVLEGRWFSQSAESPDHRYRLICYECAHGYDLECGCGYKLLDQETQSEWVVPADVLVWSVFRGWSADGEWLLFHTWRRDQDPDRGELVLVNAATQDIQIITPDDRFALSANWSPDKETIAFIQGEYPAGQDPTVSLNKLSLWLIDGDGRNARQVVVELGTKDVVSVDWSPDGQVLAFLRCDPFSPPRSYAGCDLWLTTVEESEPRIACPALGERGIVRTSWSPDGQTLAFTLCRPGERLRGPPRDDCIVGLVNRDASDPRLLVHEPPFAGSLGLTWLPDGSRLVLTGRDVWSVRVDSTDLRPIVTDVQDAQLVCEPPAPREAR